ncbi:MAG: sulfatase-like hydrolase/transferase [Muribaculaceae bacterium]|nr:sulfatase-like hydrolase/transferase [Muribaculaceae bacterium]
MRKRLIPVLLLIASASTAFASRPNIIYIMTDQQSANAMSCAGNGNLATPNIDRLANHGVRFTNAYCAMPLSGPSRSAMFTGYTPSTTGMQENETPLPDSLRIRTLGNLMKQAGYENGYSGKWHVNTNSLPADTAFGFRNLHGHNDAGLAEAAIEFMREDHGGRPMFLVASFDNPHNICEWARGQKLPFAEIGDAPVEKCPNLPPNFSLSPYEADILRWERERSYRLYPTKAYTADDWRRYRNAYFRLVEHIDNEIGKIVDEIDRQNLWENTVVIFTSDHGDGQGAHQWNQKTALWDEVINVPMIICLPDNKNAGTESGALVNNGIDLMPTVLDFAGAAAPSWCKGESLRPYAEDAAVPGRDHIVVETNFAQTGGTRGWAVRTPRFKYVLYEAGKNREMLFDMENDRLEQTNLAIEARYSEEIKRHRSMLRKWMENNLAGELYPSTRFIPVD